MMPISNSAATRIIRRCAPHSPQLQLAHRRLHPLLHRPAYHEVALRRVSAVPRNREMRCPPCAASSCRARQSPSSARSPRRIPEHLRHLVGALHEKLVLSSGWRRGFGAGLHDSITSCAWLSVAQKVMRIVRPTSGIFQIFFQPVQIRLNLSLLLQPLILNFEKKFPLAEDVLMFVRHRWP